MGFESHQIKFAVSETQYSSDDQLDVAKKVNIGKGSSGAKVTSVSLLDYQDLGTPTVDLHFFSADPGTLAADNDASTLVDTSAYLGVYVCGAVSYQDYGASKIMTCLTTAVGQGLVLRPDKDGNVWVAAKLKSAPDFGAAAAGAGLDVLLGLEVSRY